MMSVKVSSILNCLRKLFTLLCGTVILLTLPVRVSAIEFDAEEVYNSVFVIRSGNSAGSGFSVGENCIISNAHVIEDAEKVTISTYKGVKYNAFVVGIDKEKDI